jgi:hypothetical protein
LRIESSSQASNFSLKASGKKALIGDRTPLKKAPITPCDIAVAVCPGCEGRGVCIRLRLASKSLAFCAEMVAMVAAAISSNVLGLGGEFDCSIQLSADACALAAAVVRLSCPIV